MRLVGTEDRSTLVRWSAEGSAREAVTRETIAAAENAARDPADPRWQLAMRTQSLLQGSVLSAERREAVMKTARTLGVRPFEAGLIMAIVQDSSRQHRVLAEAGPILGLLPMRAPATRPVGTWVSWVAALAGAVILHALLVALLLAR
jgi:hypothetical protein